MLQPGEHTRPDLPLRDEIRALAAAAAREALDARQENRKHLRMDAQALVMVALAIVGGIVWCVRLEGRVNASDARAGAIEASVKQAQDPIIKRLDRMEDKLDQFIGEGRRR